ncbi:hypothetical protein ZIOFF_014637 [Zingiber officinale]|uniref:Uncharacterized protein n=1 Tax=Zingiber officinale TaxID=94328 RepID=A0A8J5LLT8_ZINOF|nr:hypothetical protein ZIOFF_014637 [Zingiber officinale]
MLESLNYLPEKISGNIPTEFRDLRSIEEMNLETTICLVVSQLSLTAQVSLPFNIFNGCPFGQTATIVLRGGADQFIEEAERSLHDAIIIRRALKNSTIVPGDGTKPVFKGACPYNSWEVTAMHQFICQSSWVIDLLVLYQRGGKIGLSDRASVGKTGFIMELMINNIGKGWHERISK